MDYKILDEPIEILKTAISHFKEGKPWIKSISINNYNPTNIKIDFDEDQKVTFNKFVGRVQGITYFKEEVYYAVLIDDWQDTIFVKANDIKAYTPT